MVSLFCGDTFHLTIINKVCIGYNYIIKEEDGNGLAVGSSLVPGRGVWRA